LPENEKKKDSFQSPLSGLVIETIWTAARFFSPTSFQSPLNGLVIETIIFKGQELVDIIEYCTKTEAGPADPRSGQSARGGAPDPTSLPGSSLDDL